MFLTIPYTIKPQFSVTKYVTSFFSKGQQEIITKEFTDVSDLHIINDQGNITVDTWQHPTVMIEIIKTCKDISNVQTLSSIEDGTLTLETKIIDLQIKTTVEYNIIVPENTTVTLSTNLGKIVVKQVSQDIKTSTLNGAIEIYGGQKDISAKTDNGNIIIERTMIPDETIIQALTLKGDIIFKTHQSTQACITAKTLQGKVTAELFITLFPKTTKLNSQTWSEQKKEVCGYIGSQTKAKVLLKTNYGNIKILPLHV
jgi:DUF4097 and DUF4098 domain-containing protein YvlB